MWRSIRNGIQEIFEPGWEFFKFALFMFAMVVVIAVPVSPLVYHSCKVTAQVVNEEFGTSYTAGDIFWAGSTIEDLVLGHRTRIDLNGNITEGVVYAK